MRRRAARGPGPWPDRRVARRAPLALRRRDPAPRAARPGRAGRRAAVPAGRHRDRRPSRHAAARGAGAGGDGAVEPRRAVHLPDLRDDRARHAPARRRAATRTPPRSARRRSGSRSRVGRRARRRRGGARRAARARAGRRRARRRHGGALPAHRRRSALPMALVALAGQGWLRGMGDLRTPLVIVVAANVVNVVLELLFVYGFGLGPRRLGLGHGARPARDGRRVRGVLLRASSRLAPTSRASARWCRSARSSSCARRRCCALLRARHRRVRAHRRGRPSPPTRSPSSSSASSRSCSTRSRSPGRSSSGARSAPATPTRPSPPARRMIELSLAAGLVIGGVFLALADVDPARVHLRPGRHRPGARAVAAVLRCMWPVAAVVFALDGILIGAGRHALPGRRDGRRLRRLPADRADAPTRSPACGSRSTCSCSCAWRRSAGASRAGAGRSSARTPSRSRARAAPAAGSRCARSPPRSRR